MIGEMAMVDKADTIYTEESTGFRYRKRGCPNEGVCLCTGVCEEKIYIDDEIIDSEDLTAEKLLAAIQLFKDGEYD